jgi:hypothetical protein
MDIETAKAILNFVYPDNDYVEISTPYITYQSRWYTFYLRNYYNKADNTYWELTWSRGSTEQRENGPENIEAFKVERREAPAYVYVRV